jgi:hypothetical protein
MVFSNFSPAPGRAGSTLRARADDGYPDSADGNGSVPSDDEHENVVRPADRWTHEHVGGVRRASEDVHGSLLHADAGERGAQ